MDRKAVVSAAANSTMITGNQPWCASMKAMMLSANASKRGPFRRPFWLGCPDKARGMRPHHAPVSAAWIASAASRPSATAVTVRSSPPAAQSPPTQTLPE